MSFELADQGLAVESLTTGHGMTPWMPPRAPCARSAPAVAALRDGWLPAGAVSAVPSVVVVSSVSPVVPAP